jgi:hypothetical protein
VASSPGAEGEGGDGEGRDSETQCRSLECEPETDVDPLFGVPLQLEAGCKFLKPPCNLGLNRSPARVKKKHGQPPKPRPLAGSRRALDMLL